MLKDDNLNQNQSDVNNNFDENVKMQKLKEELSKSFQEYRNKINYMAADAPISTLCLPLVIENILLKNGLLRVYDLLNLNFLEIEGLGMVRARNLTTRLDQFLSML